MSKVYQIGALARLADVPVGTIRYYESQKLMPRAARSTGNYRQYDESHVERLLFIRNCRSPDMSVTEIRQLLHVREQPQSSCGAVDAVIDSHIAQVTRRLTELKKLRTQLVALRGCCAEQSTATRCGILAGLANPTVRDKAERR